MNRIRITELEEQEKETSSKLSTKELLEIVDKNRDRIRGLAALIVNVSGLLLSSSFVVLFFSIKEGFKGILIPALLLAAVVLLVVVMLLCIFATVTERPKPVSIGLKLLDIRIEAHYKERKRVMFSVALLVASISLLVIGVLMFGAQAVKI